MNKNQLTTATLGILIFLVVVLGISGCGGQERAATPDAENNGALTPVQPLPSDTQEFTPTVMASPTLTASPTAEIIPTVDDSKPYEYHGHYPDLGRLLYEDVEHNVAMMKHEKSLSHPGTIFGDLVDPTIILYGEGSSDSRVRLDNYYKVWEAFGNGEVPDMRGLTKGVLIHTPLEGRIILTKEQIVELQRQNVLFVIGLSKKPEGATGVFDPLHLTGSDISEDADYPENTVPALMFGGNDKDFIENMKYTDGVGALSWDSVPNELNIPLDYIHSAAFIPLDKERLVDFVNRNGLGEGQLFYKTAGILFTDFSAVRGDKPVEELFK